MPVRIGATYTARELVKPTSCARSSLQEHTCTCGRVHRVHFRTTVKPVVVKQCLPIPDAPQSLPFRKNAERGPSTGCCLLYWECAPIPQAVTTSQTRIATITAATVPAGVSRGKRKASGSALSTEKKFCKSGQGDGHTFATATRTHYFGVNTPV